MRSSRRPLVWDATAGNWAFAGARETPFFMRRPTFTSLRVPAACLSVLLGLFVLSSLIAIWADAEQAIQFDDMAAGQSVTEQEIIDADGFFWFGKLLQIAVMVASAPVFIWWTRRATCNVAALAARSPDFTPGWAVGWWFVPFASLWQPLRVLNQAWRASEPNLPLEESDGWRRVAVHPVLIIWWLGWAIAGTIWGSSDRLRDSPTASVDELGNVMRFILVMDGIMAIVALLAINVVVMLSARQDRANSRFDVAAVPHGNSTWPTPGRIRGTL